MRKARNVIVALLVVVPLAGCGSTAEKPEARGGADKPAARHKGDDRSQAPRPAGIDDFAAGSFAQAPTIDNRWLPMTPGTRFVYTGLATEDDERIQRKVVTSVTELTKVVNGVRGVVILDQDYNDGELVEQELTFWAQDDSGNVWNLGEYPELYEQGKFDGAPDTWLAGLAGAKAGILMRAEPRLGTSTYRQGWAPKVGFADKARVLKMGVRTCVPYDCFDNSLVIEEWDPVEPGTQHKYHSPGVGIVRVGFSGGNEKEKLVLAQLSQLNDNELASVNEMALRLDRRAYDVRKALYSQTPPAERP